jgi:2-amino-4-hydroxy-6-hydroxymethyldihydropteridine diphosphokinase
MARCLISFGANIGDARATIQSAASRLQEQLCVDLGSHPSSGGTSFQLSRCFRTPPIGGPTGQPPFINAVAAINTPASPWDVWHCIRRIEKEFGRQRNLRWEARRIDLDILLYDEVRIWTPHLKIPHPRMCMRRFILLPAVDVAHDWLDPVSGWTIGQLAENVRQGASNFILLGDASSNPESLLVEVAQRTGAQWRSNTEATVRSQQQNTQQQNKGRWILARTTSPGQPFASKLEEISGELADAKLLIALAPPIPATDVAWEDYHRSLACSLGLLEDARATTIWAGPRYLLACDDPGWTVQELIAALEAMDCPIELL